MHGTNIKVDCSIGLFADDRIIYREITNKNDIEKLQKGLDTLREGAVENGMKNKSQEM